jgi:hypothetical protein
MSCPICNSEKFFPMAQSEERNVYWCADCGTIKSESSSVPELAIHTPAHIVHLFRCVHDTPIMDRLYGFANEQKCANDLFAFLCKLRDLKEPPLELKIMYAAQPAIAPEIIPDIPNAEQLFELAILTSGIDPISDADLRIICRTLTEPQRLEVAKWLSDIMFEASDNPVRATPAPECLRKLLPKDHFLQTWRVEGAPKLEFKPPRYSN